MKMVDVIDRNYERVWTWKTEIIGGKIRQKEEEMTKAERRGRYLMRDGMTITMNKTAKVADEILWRILVASSDAGLMELFEENTMQMS